MGRASVGTPSSRAGHGRYAEGSVAETWDSIADWYAALVRGGSAMHEFSRDILLSVLPPTLTGGHVLDVGCGEGILTRAIAVRGATVVGLDPTLRLITHAQSAEQAVPHPRFDAPSASSVIVDGHQRRVIGEYLAEGFWRSTHLQSVRRAGNYHRTIATYMTALTDHGLSVEVFAEPRPNQEVAAENPHRGAFPPFLLIRAARRVTNVAGHHI